MSTFHDLLSRYKLELAKSRVARNCINTFEVELKFLRTFLKFTAGRCLDFQNMKDLLMRAEAVEPRAQWELNSLVLYSGEEKTNRFINMAAHEIEEIKLMRSEIKEVHWIVLSSSPSHMNNVFDFIDSLLENLEYLIDFKFNLAETLKVKLEALKGKIRFLRTLMMFTRNRCTLQGKQRSMRSFLMSKRYTQHRKLNDLFAHATMVADNTAYLCYSCLVDEMDEEMLDTLVTDVSGLVRKIEPVTPEVRQIYTEILKASSESSVPDLYTSQRDEIAVEFVELLLENVMDLLSAGLKVPVRNKVKILQEELAFLRGILMDPPTKYTDAKTLANLLKQSKAISGKAGSMVYSLYDNSMNEKTAEKVYSSLVGLLKEMKLFKVHITKIYLKTPNSSFPTFPNTRDLSFLDCFLGNLRELLNNSTLPIEPLAEELQFLRSFLTKITKNHTVQEELKVLWTQIIDVAYKAEYIIDLLLVGDGPLWHRMLWLSEVRNQIGVLKVEINKIDDKKLRDSEVYSGAGVSRQPSPNATSPEMDEIVVGFKDEEENLVDDLVRGSTKLMMVSIVGMPGLGKTHLAKRIYNNPIVKDYFDVCAWCYVSQAYKREYLLTHILSQVAEPIRGMSETIDEELDEVLYKSIKGKRYLIVLDDVWDVEAWYDLRRSFPDDRSGSRIMFTSRFHNLDLRTSIRKIHHLRLFHDYESWQLLHRKLFQREKCPPELLEVGTEIAINCKGLPLTVVLVAGILSKIDKKLSEWRKVANSQSSYMVDDPRKQSLKVIELSYNHLPNYLKPCFLYLAAFLENKYISVQKLICLWAAEGFVQKYEQKSLESVAEEYLMDLIGRSLVIISKRNSTGDIKECRVHDLVRKFCWEKSKEDSFLLPIGQLQTSEQRRIYCNQPDLFLKPQAYGPYVRSLLFFYHYRVIYHCDVSFIFDHLKLLKVLDLANINSFNTFPDKINSLSLLRYLAIGGSLTCIPSTIANLQNLETFIVERTSFVVHLPPTIWNMVKLRHLHINSAVLGRSSFGRVPRLDNLQTVSKLVLSYGDETEELLEGLSNVKILRCIFHESWDSARNCNRLPILASLTQLESLRVSYQGSMLRPYKFSFPSNIKKLTLSGFRFRWHQIPIIGKLPKLEVLKLLFQAFEGDAWDMGDGEFPKLKFLKLKGLLLRKWTASGDYFPPLERLVLQYCRRLEEIPSCLADISTLNMIEVSGCSNPLKNLVKQIQEEQIDMGNQEIKVVIEHTESDEDTEYHTESEEGRSHSPTQDTQLDTEIQGDS